MIVNAFDASGCINSVSEINGGKEISEMPPPSLKSIQLKVIKQACIIDLLM